MPKNVRAAAIYARISEDRADERAGVSRQVADCQALAARLGWPVFEEYIDNDASAYSGKPRPEYRRLLADLTAGTVDAVLAWHPDRLHRSPLELETFIDVCDQRKVPVQTVQSGQQDLSTPTGRAVARTVGAWARHESEHKAERVRRAMADRASRGLPNGGSRAFGYEPDGLVINQEEAGIVRVIAARFIAGESMTSVARWLTDQQIPTASGRQGWRQTTVRKMLRSGRLSGQLERYGQIVGPAAWPAILTPDQTAAIRALTASRGRPDRPARRYLLSRLLRCYACGRPLKAQPRQGRRRYTCKPDTHEPRCGRVSIEADAVEAIVVEAVLQRLDSSHLDRAVAATPEDSPDDPTTLAARLQILTDLLADGDMTRAEYVRATRRIRDRLDQVERAHARILRDADLRHRLQEPGRLRNEWPSLPLPRQQAIIRAVLTAVTVGPGQPGRRDLTYRLSPVWLV